MVERDWKGDRADEDGRDIWLDVRVVMVIVGKERVCCCQVAGE